MEDLRSLKQRPPGNTILMLNELLCPKVSRYHLIPNKPMTSDYFPSPRKVVEKQENTFSSKSLNGGVSKAPSPFYCRACQL